MIKRPSFNSQLVNWRFTLTEQGFVVRYGTLDTGYYKQFLPAGIEVPERFPPKRIDLTSYNLALSRYNQKKV